MAINKKRTAPDNKWKPRHRAQQPKGGNRPAAMPAVLLADKLPKAGLRWASRMLITDNHHRDALIAKALKENGKLDKKRVQEQLVEVVQRAKFRFTNRIQRHKWALTKIYLLGAYTPWVAWDMKVAFAVFFRAMIDARVEVLRTPELQKLNADNKVTPCPLAIKIDEFLAMLGGGRVGEGKADSAEAAGAEVWVDRMAGQEEVWQDLYNENDDFEHYIDGESELDANTPHGHWAVKRRAYDEAHREDETEDDEDDLNEKMEGLTV